MWNTRGVSKSRYIALIIVTALGPSIGTATPAWGQSGSTQERSGVVTGYVYCGDTHQAARFASVTMQPLDISIRSVHSSIAVASTDLTGKFIIPDLLPGSYLIVAWMPGYINPLVQIKKAMDSPANTLKTLERILPRVEVKEHLTTTIDLTLVRGSSVSGSVTYDDGTPAVGFLVKLLFPRGKEGSGLAVKLNNSFLDDLSTGVVTTDDKGQFRVSGIPAGSYVIVATSPRDTSWGCGITRGGSCGIFFGPSDWDYVQVYSGNSLRFKDSVPVSIGAGEHVTDADLVITLSRLHQVDGEVIANGDEHRITIGSVELLDPDDQSTVQRTRPTSDGKFQFSFVPEGRYLLKVSPGPPGQQKIMPIDVSEDVGNVLIRIDMKRAP